EVRCGVERRPPIVDEGLALVPGLLRPDDEVRVAVAVEVAGRADADPEPPRAACRSRDDEVGHRVDRRPTEVEIRLPNTGDLRVAARSHEGVIVAISVYGANPRDRAAPLVPGVRPHGIDEDAGRDGRNSAHARLGEQGDGDESGDREFRGTPPEWQANEAGAMHGAPPTRQGSLRV